MNDGDISLNLSLDDKDFVVTVRNSGKLLRELRSDLTRAGDGADSAQRHFSSFSTKLRHTVMSLAAVRFAAMDFYDVFLKLPSSILQTSGEIERLTKLMGGLSKATTDSGRKSEALTNTKYILDLAKNAPFEVKALADSLVKLKSGGIDPTNGSMQALIDSVARFGGTSETLHRASVAIQQMAGKGVISMEELRQQLGEAIPTAMRMMAEGMGMSMADLTKQVSLGAVESTDALRRMFTVMEFYNKGAASEMMTTWVGLTSRLKTEWTILQSEIGQSGFAEAVKDQVKDLIKVMGSGEGVAMARNFGQNLATLVRTLRDVADWLRENWNWIKLLGQAMTAVFVAKRILEFGAAMRQTLKDTLASTAATAAKYRAEVTMKASTVAETTRMDLAAAQARAANDASVLAARKLHYGSLLAEHAAYIARINKLQAAADIAAARAGGGGLAGAAATAAHAARLKKIQAIKEEAVVLEKVMAREREAQAVISSGLLVSSQQVASKAKLAQAAEGAMTKMSLLTKAGIGLRVAVGALGGPIGIVTTALMLGIPAWLEWGNAGEKAIQKIRDALSSGTATEETVGLINKQLIEKRKELYELENERKGFSLLPSNPADVQRDSALKAQLEKDIADLESDLGKAKSQRFKNEASARFKASKDEFAKQEEETRLRFNSEAGAINAQSEKKLALMKKGSKEAIDEDKRRSLELRNTMVAQGEALHKISLEQQAKAQATFNAAEKTGKTGDIAVAKDYLDEVNAKLLESSRYRDETARLLTDPSFKVEKVKKPDALTQALEQSRADLATAQIKLEDLEDGIITFNRLKDAARADVEGDRLAGRYSKKDDRGNFVAPGANNKQIAEIAENKARMDQISRETQAQKALNRLKALSKSELSMSVARFDNTFDEAQTTGVHKLQRSLGALRQTLIEGTPAMEEFSKHAGQIVSDQSVADLNNYVAALKPLGAALRISLSDSALGSKQDSYALELGKLRSALEMRKRAILENAQLTANEVSALTKQADDELSQYLALRLQQHIKDMRTPLQQLTVNWAQATDRMRDASTRWANDTVDAFVMLAKGAKVEWRSLVDSILTDILRIQIQKTAGKALNNALESGIGVLGSMFGLNNPAAAAGGSDGNLPLDPVTGAVMTMNVGNIDNAKLQDAVAGQKEVFKTAQERLSSMWDGLKTGFSNVSDTMSRMLSGLGNGLSSLFSNLAGGLGSFLSGMGGGSKGGGIFGEILDIVATGVGGAMSGMGGGGMGAASSGVLKATTNGASAAFGDISGSMFKSFRFADGGIMSHLGSLSLHRYANGGIARSPQLAEFGEGRMPEAYVPLPDGRSIPVTMSGSAAGGQNVAITIIVNKDGNSDSKESNGSDDGGTWNRLAQKVKSVVREELVVQQRPGGSLYK